MVKYPTKGDPSMLEQIVSGGQSGVDRAALDFAMESGIAHGGWCPLGRVAEDGTIGQRYQLRETDSRDYAVRTERNVIDSTATLIIHRGTLTGGTLLTARLAKKWKKPTLKLDVQGMVFPESFQDWLVQNEITVLNVAGPRESSQPGIYQEALEILRAVFA